MKMLLSLIVIVPFINCVDASALDSAQLQKLRIEVIQFCRGGTIEGKSSKIAVTASAKGRIVVIKNLLEGGGDAKVEITDEQWNGMKALVNPDTYTKCVESTLNILVPELDAGK